METKYFFLGTSENSRLVKIIRIVFGIVCLIVAIFWLIFNIKSLQADGTLWITIIFLSGFGIYQVYSGLGLTTIYIEFDNDSIRLKKNPILSPVEMNAGEIERIELFPMNVIFFLKTRKRILLRFGTTYPETNEKIKDEILRYTNSNKVPIEIIKDEL
jgi:hypothetical protein